jgi:hypothetical protein
MLQLYINQLSNYSYHPKCHLNYLGVRSRNSLVLRSKTVRHSVHYNEPLPSILSDTNSIYSLTPTKFHFYVKLQSTSTRMPCPINLPVNVAYTFIVSFHALNVPRNELILSLLLTNWFLIFVSPLFV